MNVLFIINSRVSGDDLERRPLGGTETALIGVSCELAKLPGVQVTVSSNIDRPRAHGSVNYIPIAHLAQWTEENSADILISIRGWIPLWLPIKARHRIYFSPDAHDQPALHSAVDATLRIDGHLTQSCILSPEAFYDAADQFFCVGSWQASTFESELKIPRKKIYVTGNAIFPNRFKPLCLKRRNHALVYSATPFRGLEQMADFYEYLKNEQPGLQFEVCSGMGVYGHSKDQDNEAFGQLYKSLQHLGATLNGPVLQQKLSEIMCRSRVYTYPNTFAETFCISVLEAQAAGLPVVTSKIGAMPERIKHGIDGFLIDGEPRSRQYRKAFLETTMKLLRDDNLWRDISDAAIKTASKHSYKELAVSWHDKFTQVLSKPTPFSLPRIPALAKTEIPHPTRPNKWLEFPSQHIQQFLDQEYRKFGL